MRVALSRFRWLWWTLGLVAFLLMLYTCALPPGRLPQGKDNASALSGTFSVNGTDPTGAEYSGTVVIRPTATADRYDVEWIITGVVQQGTGEHRGDTFTVRWQTVRAAGTPTSGTTTYAIQPDGRLVGTWTASGVEGEGHETVYPKP